jgi:hypothetical protein
VGLLDRFTKQDVRDEGLSGTAVLRATPTFPLRHSDDDKDPLNDPLIRSWPLELNLEVRIDGRDPYSVLQEFKVPKKWFKIVRGVELPVRVDPEQPDRIVIDWEAFGAAGGKQVVEERGAQNQRDATFKAVSQNTVLREAAQKTFVEYLGEVEAGRMTVQDFNGYVDEHVTQGMLTPEEGDAFKAQAAG